MSTLTMRICVDDSKLKMVGSVFMMILLRRIITTAETNQVGGELNGVGLPVIMHPGAQRATAQPTIEV
ncbi:hypothetical protein JNO12_13905 [Erwinia aphidicola]|nr:hypothetical protein [Erwinia aphidicola]